MAVSIEMPTAQLSITVSTISLLLFEITPAVKQPDFPNSPGTHIYVRTVGEK